MTKYTVERVIKIWDDQSGEHLYVGPDADGFKCVELRNVDSEGKIIHRFMMIPEEAVLAAEAILELYGDK
jgi:hypothetical protein